ncbi:MAG: ribonuclease Z [Bacteroidia bacterium]|nr:ribonuclease Z [Bacteroidia bacterium]
MFEVQILGTSAAIPTTTRNPSAQVVSINDRHHLIDCGEGTQMQLLKYKVRFSRLDAIFISHLHGDHILGLPGLLNSLSLYERNFPLYLFGPADLQKALKTIFDLTQSYLGYELNFIPLEEYEPGDIIYEHKTFHVELLPLDHRVFCRGFRFVEGKKKRKFDFYKAKAMEIPNKYFGLLKQGNEVTLEDGRVISPDEVLSPAEPPLSYAYCSDTRYNEALVDYIKDTKLLYHESTFTEDMKDRARSTAHSTAMQAASIAKAAGVKQLLLGHYSARYKDLDQLLAEAQSVFPQSALAIEGDVHKLKDYA